MNVLHQLNANVNLVDRQNRSALMFAIFERKPTVAHYLINQVYSIGAARRPQGDSVGSTEPTKLIAFLVQNLPKFCLRRQFTH